LKSNFPLKALNFIDYLNHKKIKKYYVKLELKRADGRIRTADPLITNQLFQILKSKNYFFDHFSKNECKDTFFKETGKRKLFFLSLFFLFFRKKIEINLGKVKLF